MTTNQLDLSEEGRPMSVEGEIHSDATAVGHVALPGMKKQDPHATRWGDFLKATIKL